MFTKTICINSKEHGSEYSTTAYGPSKPHYSKDMRFAGSGFVVLLVASRIFATHCSATAPEPVLGKAYGAC